MNPAETSSTATKSGGLDQAAIPAVRSGIYAVLAHGFSFPRKEVVEFMARCGETIVDGNGDLTEAVRAVLDAARSQSSESLQLEYVRFFDPVAGLFPYESEQKKMQDFSKAQLMADIMGFYHAFHVEPSAERPDHIGAELEFMHYLALKESRAVSRGEEDNADLCRDAQKKFLTEHVVTWTDSLVEQIRGRAVSSGDQGFYTHLADLLELFIEREKEALV